MALTFLAHLVTKRFDPFAPVWLFFVGYFHVYVIQALSLREWALTVRGTEVVTAANLRAAWALAWFVIAYHLGLGRWLASKLPRPPASWSVPAAVGLSPGLIVWGFYCASVVINQGWGEDATAVSPELVLFRSFPFVMMVGGILMLVTGRQAADPKPWAMWAGLGVAAAYMAIWMFNGKRSHSLIAVLSTVCAFYVTRQKRPSWPVLFTTAFAGSMVVALSIGWRNNYNYERSLGGFVQYLGDFRLTSILESLNIEDSEEAQIDPSKLSYETLEYGGFLLMMDTVPGKSEYDYGVNYLRCVSTFIPRVVWPDKPLYGREQWIKAWQAGSELKRDDDFTGPAIGLLGAAQLNGGDVGTFLVLGALALILRTAYEFFRLYDTAPWVQAWWSLTYYNAWFMVVADDPSTWFYYNWGITCLPTLTLLYVLNRVFPAVAAHRGVAGAAA
jgi:hypothetical protein